MKVVCVGADPAALYLGILLKRTDRSHSVCFFENGGDTTPLPSSIVCNPLKPRLKLADAEVLAALNAEIATFDRVEVSAGERRFKTRGLAYAAARTTSLVDTLKGIAAGAGCKFDQGTPEAIAEELRDADLIVATDRTSSAVAGLPPADATPGANLFLAFESTAKRNALGYGFRATPGGPMHAVIWPNLGGSTVVVEAPAATIRANGLEKASPYVVARVLPQIFCRGARRRVARRRLRVATVRHGPPPELAFRQDGRYSAAPPIPRISRSVSMSARAWKTPRRWPICSARMRRSKTP